jgi:multisubunit Na+/H+ antiporter MnhC subunit
MIQGYVLTPVIATVAIMLVYGSYLILRNKNMRKGVGINFVAGLVLALLYIYYAYFSQPLGLLSWLAPSGILLIIPPILSGVIGKVA